MATMIGAERRTALVTGASSGIGEAFAEALAERGHDLVITARRTDRLIALRDTLARKHGVRVEVIGADLADPRAPDQLREQIAELGLTIDVLVNNAGYRLHGSYEQTRWAQNADCLQVLVTAVCQLTHLFLPSMLARGYGRIIQIASIAGLVPGAPGGTLYAASKMFLVRFTESLALELEGSGVHVTASCPGLTRSEFHDVDGTRAQVAQAPRFAWMDASTVARQAIDACDAGHAVYVHGAFNRALTAVMNAVPKPAARAALRRRAKLRAR
jgi:short-subunit dehydrogenase